MALAKGETQIFTLFQCWLFISFHPFIIIIITGKQQVPVGSSNFLHSVRMYIFVVSTWNKKSQLCFSLQQLNIKALERGGNSFPYELVSCPLTFIHPPSYGGHFAEHRILRKPLWSHVVSEMTNERFQQSLFQSSLERQAEDPKISFYFLIFSSRNARTIMCGTLSRTPSQGSNSFNKLTWPNDESSNMNVEIIKAMRANHVSHKNIIFND